MRFLTRNSSRDVMVLLVSSTDHVTGVTGQSATMVTTISKNGGAFALMANSIVERGDGWYAVTLSTSDTNTAGDLALHITAPGSDPVDMVFNVQSALPANIVLINGTTAGISVSGYLDTNVKYWVGSTPQGVNAGSGLVRVETESVVANAIGATQIAANAITSAKIAANAITSSQIAAGAIGATQIAADAITAAKLAADVGTEIATAVLDAVYEGSRTVRGFFRVARAVLVNKATGLETTAPAFRDEADTKNRVAFAISGGAGGNLRAPVVDET